MLYIENIDFNLTTEDGKKAKDVTQNKNIQEVMTKYELNDQVKEEKTVFKLPTEIIEEDEVEDMSSDDNNSHSPKNLRDIGSLQDNQLESKNVKVSMKLSTLDEIDPRVSRGGQNS